MRPYGERRKLRTNFPDCHPKRLGKLWGGKWKNWWEVELGYVDKRRERQQAKREIRKTLNDEQF